jgi:hypothetical protein
MCCVEFCNMVCWFWQVATGEVVVEDGNEAVEEVVREIAALWAAKVRNAKL